MKLEISSVGNQWLLSKEDKNGYTRVGKMKPLLKNSILFLFDDKKIFLHIRELEEVTVFKIQSDTVILKLLISKSKPPKLLNWKSNNDTEELMCFFKPYKFSILHNRDKIAKMKIISKNHFIFEIITLTNFHPIVLLASLYPFLYLSNYSKE